MKCKVKKGEDLIYSSQGHFDKLNDVLIINLKERYTYVDFKQKGNHLLISTTLGEVDIVFTGEPPECTFESFCKYQLVLSLKVKK